MRELPTWNAVGQAARDLGSDDFERLLRDVKNADLDTFWDQAIEQDLVDGKTVQRLEKADDEGRTRYIAGQLRSWRANPTAATLKAAAVCIRVAVGARPDTGNRLREPFRPGNVLALTSGSRSEAIIARQIPAEAEHIRDLLLADAPADLPKASEVLIEQLARVETVTRLIHDHIDKVGPLDSRGLPRKALGDLRALISKEIDLAHALGMTPRSRAAIVADLAQGSKDLQQARRSALDAEEELRRRYGA